jgi:hypothetical protein
MIECWASRIRPGERAELRPRRETMISPDGRRRVRHCRVTTSAAAAFDDPDAPGLIVEWARGRNDLWYARVVYLPVRGTVVDEWSPTPDSPRSLRPDDAGQRSAPGRTAPGRVGPARPTARTTSTDPQQTVAMRDRQGFHAHGIPDQPHPVTVRARLVREHDGEEWISGRATRWTDTSVLVVFADPAGRPSASGYPPTTSSGRNSTSQ